MDDLRTCVLFGDNCFSESNLERDVWLTWETDERFGELISAA